jgi:succinate dehydrogenase hydrophobic anchor subunit
MRLASALVAMSMVGLHSNALNLRTASGCGHSLDMRVTALAFIISVEVHVYYTCMWRSNLPGERNQ